MATQPETKSTPPSEEARLWEAAAGELTPDKSVTRINDSARFLIANVALLGTLLTGIGLLSANQNPPRLSRGVGALIVLLATAAVLLAFSSLILQTRSVRIFNLNEVEDWYRQHLRHARRVQASGAILAVAVLMAGAAAFVALTDTPNVQSITSMSYSRSDAKELKLAASVQVNSLDPGAKIAIQITGSRPSQKPIVLFRDLSTADGSGAVSVKAEIPNLVGYSSFLIVVRLGGHQEIATDLLAV